MFHPTVCLCYKYSPVEKDTASSLFRKKRNCLILLVLNFSSLGLRLIFGFRLVAVACACACSGVPSTVRMLSFKQSSFCAPAPPLDFLPPHGFIFNFPSLIIGVKVRFSLLTTGFGVLLFQSQRCRVGRVATRVILYMICCLCLSFD